jgi:hypothetical protein
LSGIVANSSRGAAAQNCALGGAGLRLALAATTLACGYDA